MANKRLLIIGARGRGREVFHFFNEANQDPSIKCGGYLDDNPNALDGFEGYPQILSSVEDYEIQTGDVFICALGDPYWVKHYTSLIENKGGEFISIISPLAQICANAKIGIGCLISSWSYISSDTVIGNHTSIGIFSDIGHDVRIGNYCHIGPYAFMGGGSVIEDEVTLHPRVNILPHKKVGIRAIVGAGSVVIRNVAENTTVFGIPAKKID